MAKLSVYRSEDDGERMLCLDWHRSRIVLRLCNLVPLRPFVWQRNVSQVHLLVARVGLLRISWLHNLSETRDA